MDWFGAEIEGVLGVSSIQDKNTYSGGHIIGAEKSSIIRIENENALVRLEPKVYVFRNL